jgi:hypothetical protein
MARATGEEFRFWEAALRFSGRVPNDEGGIRAGRSPQRIPPSLSRPARFNDINDLYHIFHRWIALLPFAAGGLDFSDAGFKLR